MTALAEPALASATVGALTVEQLVPGVAAFVTAAAPAGPREFRPSWAVLGRGGQATVWDIDEAPCAGSVWSAVVEQPFRPDWHLELDACGRGAGHPGRCAL